MFKVWLELQNMSQDELRAHIPDDEFEEIQRNHERVEAYRVAHPGKSKTHVVGEGTKFLQWLPGVINKVWQSIRRKTPIFYLHNASNATENRKKIGEVINTIKTKAGDVVAIIRRFADSLDIKTDVASFEATLNTSASDLDGHIVREDELGEITAIALGKSETAKPAFEKAVMLSYLQCFEQEEKKSMELSDILKFIQDNKISPLELFPEDTIINLDFVQKVIEEKKGNKNLYEQNKRVEGELKVLKENHQKEIDELTRQLKDSKGTIAKHEAQGKFTSLLAERAKLTPQQKSYLEWKKENLTVDPDGNIEDQINLFFDNQIKEFEQTEVFFNPGKQKTENENDQFKIPADSGPAIGDEWAGVMKFLPEN